MKHQICVIVWVLIFLVAFVGQTPAQTSGNLMAGLNRIEGRVVDPSNNGVNNAYVELYDNFGGIVARQRSTGQGRFSFRGMGPGRYTIVIKPYGTNLKEESRDVEIVNQTSRSDTIMVDIRLMADSRFQPEALGVVGTVFAQEVPQEAELLYRSGVSQIGSNRAKGIADLNASIKIFPTYFNALAAIGKAEIIAGKYKEGYPYLLRAIDVNARCSDCYYSLALAFYKLDEIAAAIKAIDAAALLRPNEPAIRLMQGMIYRVNNDYIGAEKALLRAKDLFKKPNSEVHWQLSLVYNRLKKNNEAIEELEQYLKTKTGMDRAEKENVRKLIDKLKTSK
jgi:tetratricopeptide (TPR) repeat protein